VAHQCGTSGRRVGSSGRSGVASVTLRGEPGAGAEGEQEAEVGAEVEGGAGGVPLTDLAILKLPSSQKKGRTTSGKGLLYLGYTWVDLVLSRPSKLSRASQDASKAVKAI